MVIDHDVAIGLHSNSKYLYILVNLTPSQYSGESKPGTEKVGSDSGGDGCFDFQPRIDGRDVVLVRKIEIPETIF